MKVSLRDLWKCDQQLPSLGALARSGSPSGTCACSSKRAVTKPRLRTHLQYRANSGFTTFVDGRGNEWAALGHANSVKIHDLPSEVRTKSAKLKYIIALTPDEQFLVKMTPYAVEDDGPPDPRHERNEPAGAEWVPPSELFADDAYQATGRLVVWNPPEPPYPTSICTQSGGVGARGVCTATLTGANRLITMSAHCWRRNGQWTGLYGWFLPTMIKALAYQQDKVDPPPVGVYSSLAAGLPLGQWGRCNLPPYTPYGKFRVYCVHMDTDYWKGEEPWNDFAWAFLSESDPNVLAKLPQPRPYAYHGFTKMNGRNVLFYGYPDQKGTGTFGATSMRSQTGCKVTKTFARGFYHTCQTGIYKGSSGSGLLREPANREIWGIHFGTRGGSPYAARITNDRKAMLDDAVDAVNSGDLPCFP